MADAQTDQPGSESIATSKRRVLRSWNDVAEASIDVIRAASRSVCLFSHNLDPQVYNNIAFCDTLRAFALTSRHATVQILCADVMSVTQTPHRLVELARQLSSYVALRRINQDFKDREDAFVLNDNFGIVYRGHAGRAEGFFESRLPEAARTYSAQFMRMWEHSEEEPALRRLNL